MFTEQTLRWNYECFFFLLSCLCVCASMCLYLSPKERAEWPGISCWSEYMPGNTLLIWGFDPFSPCWSYFLLPIPKGLFWNFLLDLLLPLCSELLLGGLSLVSNWPHVVSDDAQTSALPQDSKLRSGPMYLAAC